MPTFSTSSYFILPPGCGALHALWHSRPKERGSCWATSMLRAAERHDVRKYVSGRKTLHHPSKGVMTFEHLSFRATDEPSLRTSEVCSFKAVTQVITSSVLWPL
jgi:hypothetical protein